MYDFNDKRSAVKVQSGVKRGFGVQLKYLRADQTKTGSEWCGGILRSQRNDSDHAKQEKKRFTVNWTSWFKKQKNRNDADRTTVPMIKFSFKM